MNQHPRQQHHTVAQRATPQFENQIRTQRLTDNAYTLGFLDGYDDQPRAPHLHRYNKKQTAAYNRGHADGLDLCDNR